jgi:hypothetical protein
MGVYNCPSNNFYKLKGEITMELYKENGLKKGTFSKNPNKMDFESGHKTFDRQTNYLGTGNVLANTQHSSYIRSANDFDCPPLKDIKKGQLRDLDLKSFTYVTAVRLPYLVEKYIKEVTEDQPIILYQLRHFNNGEKKVDGYIITDTNYNHLATFVLNQRAYESVLEARKYLAIMPKENSTH